MDISEDSIPEMDGQHSSKCTDREASVTSAPPHKPLRFCRSIGEDSAIGMQLPDENLLNNSDAISEGSFRSVSQTDDRMLLSSRTVSDGLSLAPTLNEQRHHPLERQYSSDTSKFFPATSSRQSSTTQEPTIETYNPMFSRAPSTIVNHGPHLIHHASTFPALQRTQEGQVPQYHQYTQQPQHILHSSAGQLVPLRPAGYGLLCASNNGGVYGSSYYTVQSPPSAGNMSRMSSQVCFSPDQPIDVRVPYGFVKPPVQKTESLTTSNISMYYSEDIAALRPLHPRQSQSSSNEEMSEKTKNRLFRYSTVISF